MTDKPTHMDVLLGRGVATNRHPGNQHYRSIISQHADVYLTSTKKQKMSISRSIVNKIHTELNPPGKFLEKKAETGLWHEVDNKRALEKTAQALRDGAAPLRKQLLEDMSDPAFLDALFDGDTFGESSLSRSTAMAQMDLSSKGKNKKHRRTITASSIGDNILSLGSANPPRPKKQRSNPDIVSGVSDPVDADNKFRVRVSPTPMPQNQLSSTGINTMDTNNPQTKAFFGDQSLTEAFTLGLPSEVSNIEVSASNPSTAMQHRQGKNDISETYDTDGMEHRRERTVSREGIDNGFNFIDDYAPLPWKPVHGETATATSMDGILKALEVSSDSGCSQTAEHQPEKDSLTKNDFFLEMVAGSPPMTDIWYENKTNDTAAALVQDENFVDEEEFAREMGVKDENYVDKEEFAREMGPDEHFFGLCNSDPIDGVGGDVIFNQSNRIITGI
eukprot:CAMPEP_0201962964 /NCGR_PEP_ID=MMETSP0904-20121228/8980_1 /ASSEMBLY_ACC=CAM_ASM_000553 /TAXON_ID=420261 /ORGANISM="Thalassiosira antarctica, Strain CCMP982" /LENGTH=445 /DNA_ID=CAMNT_0048509473 /DNA_START=113 /DNA_END=1450 /DNA_ORIENTATION=+